PAPDTDLYARVAYKIGGFGTLPPDDSAPPDPSGGAPVVVHDPDSERSLRVGLSGYAMSPTGSRQRYRGWRAGGDLDLWWGVHNLFGAAWLGEDEPRVGKPVRAAAGFAQLDAA